MKSLTEFLQCVLKELGTWCGISTARDGKTIMSRVEHEGQSFLTIVLPKFCGDFEKSLDQGFVDSSQFVGFQRSGGLPRFLSGFLRLVFDAESGRLLPDPSIEAIRAIRQITLMFAKIRVTEECQRWHPGWLNFDCSPERTKAAFDRYMECEQDVRSHDATANPDRVSAYRRLGVLLWADVLSLVDQQVYEGTIIPKHGPGATAEHLGGNAKWQQQEWTQRLEQVFPHWEHLATGWSLYDRLDNVRILEPGSERPVRVITVPKTLKSPRIIAVEPACMQYMQQGLLEAISGAIDGFDIPRRLVSWASQVPNQHLAWKGSEDQTLCTLDLSEASDRVSNQHVRILLRHHPHLQGAVDASRSRKADVPGHGVIRLAKFASMGSALCFPFESMVFATMIFVGIEEQLNRQLTKKDIQSYLGQVRVYGDDIIVPVDCAVSVMAVLEDFGLRVNASKSFWTGKFRESCGKDFYDGHDVTVVRMRTQIPSSRRCTQEIVSTVSLRNQLYKAGLWRSARHLDDALERLIPFPRVSETSPMLGAHTFLGPSKDLEMCEDLHRPIVTGMMVASRSPVSRLDDYGALLKCLTQLELRDESLVDEDDWNHPWNSTDLLRLPAQESDHLERTGRPRVVRITHAKGPF